MEVFQLSFDKKDATYYPGDTVTGKIFIENTKIVRARDLQIWVEGKAITDFLVSQTNMNNQNSHYGKKTWITYLDINETLCEFKEGRLMTGKHEFPFNFIIPRNSAPSFKGKQGRIRYRINVKLDVLGWFEKEFYVLFTVLERLDMLHISYSSPIEKQIEQKCDRGFGMIRATIRLPKRGYSPLETIPISISFDNQSKRTITGIRVWLNQEKTLTIMKYTGPGEYDKNEIETEKDKTKRWCENIIDVDIPPRNTDDVYINLRVPKYTPVLKMCEIIDIKYSLEVEVFVWPMVKLFKEKLSIEIGNASNSQPSFSTGTVNVKGPTGMRYSPLLLS